MLIAEYKKFKAKNVEHFRFNVNASSSAFSEFILLWKRHNSTSLHDLGEHLPPSTLQLVQIYFDTATFDDIEREKKIKTEAQLSLIGGTMGLLTGFSIISSIEIIFFLFRFVSCLLIVHVPDIHIFLVQVGMLFPLAQVASKLEMIVFLCLHV